jgi:hypothetical protein
MVLAQMSPGAFLTDDTGMVKENKNKEKIK